MYKSWTSMFETVHRNSCAVCCFIICVIVHSNVAFNLDTWTATVNNGPEGSMFGFSVALYKDHANAWTLVGAPRAQTSQPNVTEGGAVYRCHTDKRPCIQIPFDPTGSKYELRDGWRGQTDDKSNQWFGATVGSVSKDGLIIACAPRYVYFSMNYKRREPVGTCWIARNSLNSFEEYAPCRTNAWGLHKQGFCQAGMSAALTEDGKRLFVGAVGSWYWQGQVFSKDLTSTRHDYQSSESPSKYDDSYLGYSSAVGEFNGDKNPDVAVGMPRGHNLSGMVVLFSATMQNLENITGHQIGEYFGYSVCVSDVNGDGLDDIVVGAPLYSNVDSKVGKYEEGRVYVFQQSKKHKFETYSALDGEYTKGRFGLALASLKDVNRDGFQDFAVGAPYAGKDEKGVVYIYHGSPSGIMPKPSQIITPEDFSDPGLSTLGFSIHGGVDMDTNDYPDIVIGAYDSDKSIFMRARPVVNIISTMKLSLNKISLDETTCTRTGNKTKVACVNGTLCLLYNGIGIDPELSIKLNMTVDAKEKNPRALFMSHETAHIERTLTLRKNVQYCNVTTVYIQHGIVDKLTPILIQAEYSLIDVEHYRYILNPILNQNVLNVASQELHIKKNCGDDDVCIPDLQLLATPNAFEYIIGNGKRLEINLFIHNAGDDAFEAKLFVKLPLDVNYVNINKTKLDFPVSCSGAQPDFTGVNELVCDIGNPLPSNKTLNFAIILTPSRIVSSVTDIVFSLVINSTNPELKETLYNNDAEIILPVRVKVNLDVQGISEPAYITLNKSEELPATRDRETDVGPEVTHIYEVANLGESHNSIRQAEVYILWPTYTLDDKFLLYMMNQPEVKGKAECKKVDGVNPLHLTEIRRKPRSRSYTDIMGMAKFDHLNFINPETFHSKVRERRNVDEDEDETEEGYFNDEEQNEFDEELSCGATRCTVIYCIISNLEEGELVELRIRSRLWKETYYQFGVSKVQTSSKIIVRVTELPYGVDPAYLPYKAVRVSTMISLLDVGYQSYAIPWWIIILAVCGGLILLALLALLLWKLGFFERKRVKEEREMLHEKNGYHMVHGDAAL